ncbi:hypothetical protein [Halorubrum laminariae]|uniref:ABC transporter permease n=1 Tax=Halorubrum laminariae TaxID=1433523 RepID=A0ABD6C0M2_9EURY|nr:hypothetical protein [Halorubrum laminariae]
MNRKSLLRHSRQIARIEATRSRRQLAHSSVLRALVVLVVVGLAIGSGIAAYGFGTMVRSGQATLPLDTLYLVATGGVLAVLVGIVQRTSRLAERLNTDHLLTTVSARAVVLGVVLAVARRTAVRIAPTAVSVTVGFAVGVGSPVTVLTLLVAVAGLFALTALVGVCLSFAIELLTTRSPRFRRYKNVFVVIGFFLVIVGWSTVGGDLLTGGVLGRLGSAMPPAWFVDLGLLGSPAGPEGWLRGLGALALVVTGLPVLTVVTTVLATRVWETEPVSAAVLHRSRSLVGAGLAERLFAGHVSRPVLTVARKRWLQERRVPQALLMVGYLPLIVLFVLFPALAAGGALLAPILFAFLFATGTGFAFGMQPISTEYSSLPMTLTTITGDQFVRGTMLSGVAIGTPVTTLGTLLLATQAGSPVGNLEAVALGLTGGVLSICGVAVAAVIGMRVSSRELVPAPVPLTSVTMYAEVGSAGFLRMGSLLGLLALVCLPAVCGYLPVVFESGSTMVGVPSVVVRVGSLVVTTLLAGGISIITYQRAVRRFDQYTLS